MGNCCHLSLSLSRLLTNMPKIHAVGIDLGTTMSAVAYIADTGQTTMLRNSEGDFLTPSVVLFDNENVVVGKAARRAVGSRAGSVAECAKRDMGKKSLTHPIQGENLPPEVIQACILKQLKRDATEVLGDDFQVVITVPAFFDERRRRATADAGEMAGLNVLDIVNEPTAAALAYGEHLGYLTTTGAPREDMKVLIYDLGGGTFDVTLIELKPGDVRTIATDGDVYLGGRDWDQRLVNYVADQFVAEHGEDPRQDPGSCARLFQAVEQAKQTLSVRSKTTVTVEHFGRSSVVEVTRKVFEELTEDLLERTSYTSRQVLVEGKCDWDEIDRVLLVGGSTRMPMVAQMLEELSGITPDRSVNPDEAVARGAAIYAAYLMATKGVGGASAPQFKVVDVNSHSLGIEGIDQSTGRKENIILIPRNTPLPARVANRFVTKMQGQKTIVVKVLEGESTDPAACITIGKAVMRNLPDELRKGHPIEVAYRYGANGRLDVRARVPGTNREIAMELQRDGGMTTSTIEQWRQVITSTAGFSAFEKMLENVLDLDDSGNGDASSPNADGNTTKTVSAGVDATIRWSGEPKTGAATIKSDQHSQQPDESARASATSVAEQSDEEAGTEVDDFSDVESAASESTRAPLSIVKIDTVSKRPSQKGRLQIINVMGHVLAPLLALVFAYLLLKWLGMLPF